MFTSSATAFMNRIRDRKRLRELSALAATPRRKPGLTKVIKLSGNFIHFADGPSFEEQYWQIYHRRIYDILSESPRPRMIDGGANIGLATLRFLEKHPHGHVDAFEPDPSIFEILKKNTQHISPRNLTLHNAALWDTETTIPFTSEGSDSGTIRASGNTCEIQVKTLKLSNIITEPIDLLKLDIEGAEIPVIHDAEPHLHLVRNLFVEHHSFEGLEQDLDHLLRILTKSGFRYKLEGPEVKFPYNFATKSYLGMDSLCNVYAYRV